MAKLLDASTVIDPGEMVDFTASLLEASTEYSIIGEGLDAGVFTTDAGWQEVVDLLRGDSGPVVTSYSSRERFPSLTGLRRRRLSNRREF